jgi:hypothetical protein
MSSPVVWPRIQSYQQDFWSPIATYMGLPTQGAPTQIMTSYPFGPAYPLTAGAEVSTDNGPYSHNMSSTVTDANAKSWTATSIANGTTMTATLVNPITSTTYTYGPVPLL